MHKLLFTLVAVGLLLSVTMSSRSQDPIGRNREGVQFKMTLIFKSNNTLNFTFANGSLVNLPNDFEHMGSSSIKKYTYDTRASSGGVITVDLRELAAVTMER